MNKKQKFQNDPAKFFLYQDRLLTQNERNSALTYSYELINLDCCPICKDSYDLACNAPRILVQCGHTVCTSCLYYLFKDQCLRCPICTKLIRRLRLIEILPLNHQIYYQLIAKNLPKEKIDPINQKLKICSELLNEFTQKEDFDFPICEIHKDRIKHFLCFEHNFLLCRSCIIESYHNCANNIVDLYSIRFDEVKDILARFYYSILKSNIK